MKRQVLKIKSIGKRNGFSLTAGSGLLFAILLSLLSSVPEPFQLSLIFLISLCCVGVLIGIYKIMEPLFAFELDQTGMIYNHQKGELKVRWQQILRVDVPTITIGIEQRELPYVGLKLNDPEAIVDQISLRLISHLILEQKNLLAQAMQNNCSTGQCNAEALLETAHFHTKQGRVFKGLQAMMAHRMKIMREELGYDLLFPASALDRDPQDFVVLLRDCKQSAVGS